MNANTGTCLYCDAVTPDPPCTCPGCGRGLSITITGTTTLQELGAALALNGHKAVAKLDFDVLSVTMDKSDGE